MRTRTFLIGFFLLIILFPCIGKAAKPTGIRLFFKDRQGVEVGFYTGSYALLIGVSDYTDDWPDLERIPNEFQRVESALKKHGFQIDKVLNPTGDQMKKAFDLFIRLYGHDKNNRLLFFFAGHGYTGRQAKKSYLVPSDAPDPAKNKKAFLRKSLDMGQILGWSRQIEAKHALFLFDSCFEGTIFEKKIRRSPTYISSITSQAVRQFITAGSAGEEVPAQSAFAHFLVRALKGDADFNDDGYVTGTELGVYLHKKMLDFGAGQTPQYGKIKDPLFNQGDFVFQIITSSKDKTTLLSSQTSNPEIDMWELVKDSRDIKDIKDFLATFPDGQLSNAARSKLINMERLALFDKGKICYDSQDYQEALKWFQKAAVQGYAAAQNYVGLIYHEGKGVKKDIREALKWFQKAADQGHAGAQRYIALINDAQEEQRKEERDIQALFDKGLAYYGKKDFQEALKWLQEADKKGHPGAQKYIAFIHDARKEKRKGEIETQSLFDKGLEYYNNQSYQEALSFFLRAAEQGDANGQNYAGLIYDAGKGIQKDEIEAIKWFLKAAEQGHKFARYNLGLQYYIGDEVAKDYQKALKWFLLAAEQGHPGAQNYAGLIYDAGKGIKKDEIEAIKWFLKAAEQGHKSAQYNTGLQYYEGNEIQKDYQKALKWFLKAAQQRHPKAQNLLGIMYENGLGAKADTDEAIKWYRESSKNGSSASQRALKRLEI
ncbi:MAG: SEL1-like repeat protein [Deltaproteobacteria bacterium]|nr:SEL1-like repeat protein [Deltaproteobacteria bacterium]